MYTIALKAWNFTKYDNVATIALKYLELLASRMSHVLTYKFLESRKV